MTQFLGLYHQLTFKKIKGINFRFGGMIACWVIFDGLMAVCFRSNLVFIGEYKLFSIVVIQNGFGLFSVVSS